MANILVVDDEPALLSTVAYTLRRNGHVVRTAADGVKALEEARRAVPELIVLDVMLPRMDGLAVCLAVRRAADPLLRTTPVLMLSARVDEADKVVGLEMGADDYVTKPFAMRELQARISALLRRSRRSAESDGRGVTFRPLVAGPGGELEPDLHQRQLRRHGKAVPLKPREFDLLAFLLSHPDQVFTREQLLDRIWAKDGQSHIGDIRTVDVHVRWLREKIERAPSRPEVLETVRGVGYRARVAGGGRVRPAAASAESGRRSPDAVARARRPVGGGLRSLGPADRHEAGGGVNARPVPLAPGFVGRSRRPGAQPAEQGHFLAPVVLHAAQDIVEGTDGLGHLGALVEHDVLGPCRLAGLRQGGEPQRRASPPPGPDAPGDETRR